MFNVLPSFYFGPLHPYTSSSSSPSSASTFGEGRFNSLSVCIHTSYHTNLLSSTRPSCMQCAKVFVSSISSSTHIYAPLPFALS